jgi:hypothetical protein
VLPIPVVNLWRWSVRLPSEPSTRAQEPAEKPVLSFVPPEGTAGPPPPNSAVLLARGRLEDQFRLAYRERQSAAAAADLRAASSASQRQT